MLARPRAGRHRIGGALLRWGGRRVLRHELRLLGHLPRGGPRWRGGSRAGRLLLQRPGLLLRPLLLRRPPGLDDPSGTGVSIAGSGPAEIGAALLEGAVLLEEAVLLDAVQTARRVL